MRLIDADATLKRLKAIEDAHRQIKELGACHGLLMAQEVVMESETIEQKRGRWEVVDYEEPRRYGCSECKRLVWHTENYCPNCGTRME